MPLLEPVNVAPYAAAETESRA
ncbi:hypothetical protein A2U01_0117857, partial [Trifolium medium]|nr:hypothetical protein [Trifolium medium]